MWLLFFIAPFFLSLLSHCALQGSPAPSKKLVCPSPPPPTVFVCFLCYSNSLLTRVQPTLAVELWEEIAIFLDHQDYCRLWRVSRWWSNLVGRYRVRSAAETRTFLSLTLHLSHSLFFLFLFCSNCSATIDADAFSFQGRSMHTVAKRLISSTHAFQNIVRISLASCVTVELPFFFLHDRPFLPSHFADLNLNLLASRVLAQMLHVLPFLEVFSMESCVQVLA